MVPSPRKEVVDIRKVELTANEKEKYETIKRLAEDGVDTDKILVDKNISTGCAFVSYDSSGDRKFISSIVENPLYSLSMIEPLNMSPAMA